MQLEIKNDGLYLLPNQILSSKLPFFTKNTSNNEIER